MTVLVRLAAAGMMAMLGAVLGGGCDASRAPRPIQLGGIFNLTGAQASLDVPSRNGAALAVAQINAAGGVLGRRVDLVTADGETDATVIETQTGALVSGGAAAIGAALAATRDLAGVTGTISYADGSRVPRKTVTVVRLQDGQRALAAQVVPTHVPPP